MGKKDILIIDDNQTNLQILKLQCAKWGLQITPTLSPQEAIELVSQNNYDLIITDMHMPEIDGVEMTRVMRQQAGEQLPPVIMLTSLGNITKPEDREMFAAWLTKPVRQSQLYNTLMTVLTQKNVNTT